MLFLITTNAKRETKNNEKREKQERDRNTRANKKQESGTETTERKRRRTRNLPPKPNTEPKEEDITAGESRKGWKSYYR